MVRSVLVSTAVFAVGLGPLLPASIAEQGGSSVSEPELIERSFLVSMAAAAECRIRNGQSREEAESFLTDHPWSEHQVVWLQTSPRAQQAVQLTLAAADSATCRRNPTVSDQTLRQQLMPLLSPH
jgi:hypothetical protein